MNPDDRLPIPIALGIPTRDDVLNGLREEYADELNTMMTGILSNLALPDDQACVCLDFAQLTAFLMCIKVVEAKRQPLTRENLMAVWWPFQKALKDDVPGQLRAFADELAGQG